MLAGRGIDIVERICNRLVQIVVNVEITTNIMFTVDDVPLNDEQTNILRERSVSCFDSYLPVCVALLANRLDALILRWASRRNSTAAVSGLGVFTSCVQVMPAAGKQTVLGEFSALTVTLN